MPLRHYRWAVFPKRTGVRLVAAPKPRLKEIQRRMLRHVLAPVPLHPLAHPGVPAAPSAALGLMRAPRRDPRRLESFFISIRRLA